MTGLLETPNVQRLLWTNLFVFQIKTPSKVYLDFGPQSLQVPFYRTVWFVVLLAAASIVIIIMVVAILCVKAKTYKYKGKNSPSLLSPSLSLAKPSHLLWLFPQKNISIFTAINPVKVLHQKMIEVSWSCDVSKSNYNEQICRLVEW